MYTNLINEPQNVWNCKISINKVGNAFFKNSYYAQRIQSNIN